MQAVRNYITCDAALPFSLLLASLFRPLSVLDGGRVIVGKESHQGWGTATGLLDLGESVLDLEQQLLGDGLGGDDLAGLGSNFGCHCGISAENGQVKLVQRLL
jgi:hypothetical protein